MDTIKTWFNALGWSPQPFQEEAWKSIMEGEQGLVNAPKGSGKTYSVFLPALLRAHQLSTKENIGIRIIWITPIRALAKEIEQSAARAMAHFTPEWSVEIRTGDTGVPERQKQKKRPPEVLITTPESLHLLLASPGYSTLFAHCCCLVADEWHEFMGSKRGVQVQLAWSRLSSISPSLRLWGISATIGNLEEALWVLLGKRQGQIIRAKTKKEIEVHTVLPDEVDRFPWGGHLGISLLPKVIPILHQSKSALIFTNTRAQAEIWYQKLLEAAPDLAGIMAMHHGSISKEIRHWVEDALYQGSIQVVVCTGSLDLGVDFRPVDTVIQIGSPKGVGRFLQRAGRSGHQPGATARIHFVPTHSLEIIEGDALRQAISQGDIEPRMPYLRSFDVLIQYVLTLAVSDGFDPVKTYREVKQTFSFESLEAEEWEDVLQFVVSGGPSLASYPGFQKLFKDGDVYRISGRKMAMLHRLSIGTITSDQMLSVKTLSGKHVGFVEEWFASKLNPGDHFWLAGKNLAFSRIHEMTVQVSFSNKKSGQVPAYMGGRMPLSNALGTMVRQTLDTWKTPQSKEMQALSALFALQEERSLVPERHQLLIETLVSKEGYHCFFYPIEGRLVHEGLASLLAYRLSKIRPISFSISLNDYGFELLSDQPIPLEEALKAGLLSGERLLEDIYASVNMGEMARRRFRDIARIAGLVFTGYPGKPKKDRHLQANSSLFFDVFMESEPNHILLKQAFEEVYEFQLDQGRMQSALNQFSHKEIVIRSLTQASPFGFPIMVERIRERFTSEQLEDRVKKMLRQME
jgi:ATP-dependent Lhr-like helicase